MHVIYACDTKFEKEKDEQDWSLINNRSERMAMLSIWWVFQQTPVEPNWTKSSYRHSQKADEQKHIIKYENGIWIYCIYALPSTVVVPHLPFYDIHIYSIFMDIYFLSFFSFRIRWMLKWLSFTQEFPCRSKCQKTYCCERGTIKSKWMGKDTLECKKWWKYYGKGIKNEKTSLDKHTRTETPTIFLSFNFLASKIHKGINQMSITSIKSSQMSFSLLTPKER